MKVSLMMGQKRFIPKLFYHLCLEDFVPQDHLLHRIAAGWPLWGVGETGATS